MELSPGPSAQELTARLTAFMHEHVYPAEPVYAAQRAELEAQGRRHHPPAVVAELAAAARAQGLWNLFLPDESGLSVSEYAPLAEITGRSPDLAPEALNCAAPDTGNMELLHMFGTPEQKERWLEPLLDGRIRSAFAMTEPAVASSDARNITTEIARDGDELVITGRKWWTTGISDPRCEVMIVMGRTDPEADAHHQQSMVLVPVSSAGVTILRSLPVFGYHDQHGHGEVDLVGVRVPASNLLGEAGSGFALAQARLGPGRVHHCMRAIGTAERALDLMCARAASRTAFGGPLSRQGMVQDKIARARLSIDQARLLVLRAAQLIDTVGARAAATEIAGIKAVVPAMACQVVDDAIQVFGGAGVADDVPLASMYAGARTLRIADGPDEVHLRTVARAELARVAAAAGTTTTATVV